MFNRVSKKVTQKAKWRKLQRKSQNKRRFLYGVVALGLIIFIILFGKMLGLVKSINQSYLPDTSRETSKSYHWDGSSVLSLVVRADNLFILSFNPADKSLKLLKIPAETYLNLPFDYGRWPARSIYNLGQAENPPIGAKLLKQTISSSFGIPVDGYLLISDNFFKTSFADNIEKIKNNPFYFIDMVKNSRTDLSLNEISQFYLNLRMVRFDKIKQIDLEQTPNTRWEVLADGSRILTLEPTSLDRFIQSEFADEKFGSEGLNISIFNATDHPRMAEQAAKIVTNLGGRVVMTSNLNNPQNHSAVLGKDSYTKKRLAQIFVPACLLNCKIEDESEDFSRADINVILGEDYFLKFNRPTFQ